MISDDQDQPSQPRRKVQVFGRHVHMPQSRGLRIGMGAGLMVFGVFGFLPVLGFWMLPLGLLILSYEFATVRRGRRRLQVWWERRRRRKNDVPPETG